MSATEYQLKVNRESVAFVRCWMPAQAPQACVQIVHGMSEHGGRYARFASALNKAGFAVFAQDLPGHGRSARAPDELGHFADDHGWRLALQAIRAVQVDIREKHAGLPLLLFGHSLGGLLSQDYIVHHGREIAACVLSSTTGSMGLMRSIGLGLMTAEKVWAGPRHRSALAEALSFKAFNRKFKPNRTDFDWLSRDAEEVNRYVDDPRCGFRASTELWLELLAIGARLREPVRLARIPKTLPILLIAGSDDPATQGLKGPRALEQAYRSAGIEDVTLKGYEGARHELLNDLCREQVTADIVQWLLDKAPA
ncbi:lysophospholipase [Panacagrimonas sp.]|uniref:alpha/beta hydrolase n=1 Tax=Panacagrimonas sp. TaxID=2480088 RepID=UPI003B52E772